jgi:hypothetical protein
MDLPNVTKIESNISFALIQFTQGDNPSIEISVEEENRQYITTEIANNTLKLSIKPEKVNILQGKIISGPIPNFGNDNPTIVTTGAIIKIILPKVDSIQLHGGLFDTTQPIVIDKLDINIKNAKMILEIAQGNKINVIGQGDLPSNRGIKLIGNVAEQILHLSGKQFIYNAQELQSKKFTYEETSNPTPFPMPMNKKQIIVDAEEVVLKSGSSSTEIILMQEPKTIKNDSSAQVFLAKQEEPKSA